MPTDEQSKTLSLEKGDPLSCGIIMPISSIDGCSAEHWSEVKQIIHDAVDSITEPKFSARLVSDADDIGVIQKRIIQGIYSSDIVVCDVSAKNANVMFELGMRLAFDKPTIIIKDDKTDYSFDTSIIEHLTYPRDLRFSKIIAFKKNLADKILATHKAAQSNPEHSTFLKNFGTFKVAHLNQKEASGEQLMIEMISEMQREISSIRRSTINLRSTTPRSDKISEIVTALTELRKKDSNLILEPSDQLTELMIENFPSIVHTFRTKRSFDAALTEACEIAEIFLG